MTILININLSVGLKFIIGFCVQFSLGHAGFYGLLALNCTAIMNHLKIPTL